MAFCPNCGTPNTDQAATCVNCAEALPHSSGGSKFKGTIMMGVAGAPNPTPAPKPPGPAQAQAQAPAGQPTPGPHTGPGASFQKTMLGVAMAPPAQAPPAASETGREDLGTAPTLEQASPVDNPPPGYTGSQGGFAPQEPAYSPSGFDSSGMTSAPPRANATKMMIAVLGGAIVLAALIVGAALVLREPAPSEPAPNEPATEGAAPGVEP